MGTLPLLSFQVISNNNWRHSHQIMLTHLVFASQSEFTQFLIWGWTQTSVSFQDLRCMTWTIIMMELNILFSVITLLSCNRHCTRIQSQFEWKNAIHPLQAICILVSVLQWCQIQQCQQCTIFIILSNLDNNSQWNFYNMVSKIFGMSQSMYSWKAVTLLHTT